MTQHIFIGVDGGGTKSTIRIEDEDGRLIGQEISGPANIRLSVKEAWHSIYLALDRILKPLALSLNNSHIGIGLAGCELIEAQHAFLAEPHPFKTLIMSSDAHVACLGAHKGRDGAIIIAGTGVVGYQIHQQKITKVSGWGFPNDDEGSGAWLGLQAVKITLKWRDGRHSPSQLAKTIFAHFNADQDYLVSWANRATSTEYATLAPFVIQHGLAGDSTARRILKAAALAIQEIGDTLERAQGYHTQPLWCSLIGGITPFIQPYLDIGLQSRLVTCQLEPVSGAILLIREHIQKEVFV